MKHPSLTSPSIQPPDVHAVNNMAPYVPCWCHSGKKYKFCHYRRDREKPANLFADQVKYYGILKQGYCSYPDRSLCSGSIIGAHSLQRNGGLAAIAEKGHVLTVKPDLKNMIAHDGSPPPARVGIGKASVFAGFCGHHDDNLFKPIEGVHIDLTKFNAFLFAYRAISYERFAKQAQLKIAEIQRSADNGQPLWKQELMQRHMNAYEWGVRLGLRDTDGWKSDYDTALLTKNLTDFNFYALRLDSVLPIINCCNFHVEIDLDGNVLQKLGTNCSYEGLSLTITAFSGETVAIFGWIGTSNGPAAQFVDTVKRLPDDRVADALVRIAFHQSDNIYLRESWWNSLDVGTQNALRGFVQSGTQLKERKANDLVDTGTSLASARVVEKAFS